MKLQDQYLVTFKNPFNNVTFYAIRKLDKCKVQYRNELQPFISKDLKRAAHFYSKRAAKTTWFKIKNIFPNGNVEIKSIFSV